MFQNYLKIAWRNLLRRKFYSLLNSIGLATGLTFSLLIGSYLWGEYQVNRQLRHADRQCIVQSRWKEESRGMSITTLAPLGPALKAYYPTLVANYYRFHGVNATLSKGPNHFRESIQIGDSTLLTLYGFRLLHGDPRTALNAPNAIVLTAVKAQKLFGRSDVLNQPLTVETPQAGKQTFVVTGVLDRLPRNSVTNLLREPDEVFMSTGALRAFGADMNNWQNPYIVTYVELQPGVTPRHLDKPLARLIARHTPADTRGNLTAYVTPLTDFYLKSDNGLVRRLMLALSVAGLFILLMAVVNFVTISISSSSDRLREIGVRKALGGLRRQLTVQFLLEALLLMAVAAGLSTGFYVLLRPLFSGMVGKEIPPLADLPWQYVGLLPLLILGVGGLAGAYPALHLSAYSAVDALKGRGTSVKEGRLFRQSLVTLQFAIAVFVFVGAVFVSRQIAYFRSADLGFSRKTLLTVSSLPRNWTPEGVRRMEAVREQLARISGIDAVSMSFEIPNGNEGNSVRVYRTGQDSTRAISMKTLATDEHYTRTYQIELLSGQYFRQGSDQQDSTGIVLNRSAVRVLGFRTPADAVGQTVRLQGSPRRFRVMGVIDDFHFNSLHRAIEPVAIGHVHNVPYYRFFSFQLSPGNPKRTITALEAKWRELFPDAPFEYAFMDETLDMLYQTELQLEKATHLATALALLIVGLGVVGQVSLSVTRRTKEVGIRKALGASVPDVIGLFLREYMWMMLIANLIAWPLAFWTIADWLADYAYHTALSWLPFGQVALMLAALTSLIITVQLTRTALMNPVNSLRAE